MKRTVFPLTTAMGWWAVAALAPAQSPASPEVSGKPVEAPPSPAESGSPAPAAESAKPSPEQAALQQVAQQLMQANFQRTAAAILQAQADLAEPAAASPPETPDPAADGPAKNAASSAAPLPPVVRDVLLGNWEKVGEALAKFPEPMARQLFRRITQQLVQPLQQQRQNRQQLGRADLPVVLPAEILQIATAAPFPLGDAELSALGALLKVAVQQGFPVEPLVAALEKGTPVLGGTDAAKRAAAAQLLAAGGFPGEAVKFVPALPEARQQGNARALLIHAEALLAAALKAQSDAMKLQSWETVLAVLALPGLGKEPRDAAMQQCLGLMDQVPPDAREGFFKGLLTTSPAQARGIIAAAAAREGGAAFIGNAALRGQALQLLHEMGRLTLASFSGEARRPWLGALNLMTLPWLDEADLLTAQKQNPNPQQGGMDPDMNGMPQQPQGGRVQNQAQTVEPEKMLAFAPTEEWLAVLDPSVALRVRYSVPAIAIRSDAEETALRGLAGLAALDRRRATDLTVQFLQGWAQKRNPGSHQMRSRYNRYYGGPYGYDQQGGIPITRALQERNVTEFAGLLENLRTLPLEALNPDVLSGAFVAMHSNAEVFRGDDIIRAFGPVEKIDPEVLTGIIDVMRQRLATTWRQAKTQEQAKTKRTDKEITAEVERGYGAASSLIEAALAAAPKNWRFHLIHAAIAFDWAEFKYGNKTTLTTYAGKREESFSAFAEAASLYAAGVKSLKPADYDVGAYIYWFNANLGASDLSYVTRQQEPSEKNLEKIRRAILDLGGEAARKHLDRFAETISGGLRSLPPHLKHPYVSAAIKVLGTDHPKAKEAAELQRFYADLLGEIELHVAVDGDTSVGREPFGVLVSLRYTDGIGREADGFRKFLTNQTQNQNYYSPYGTPPQDYRDQFEKQVREQFEKGFEVLGVSFADPKEPYRSYGRTGWRETAYAYLLLRAKDPAVDQLPSLRLDFDFADQFGTVVLPKASSVLAIDARGEKPPARPVENLEITQILDERELHKGVLTLDIKAAGRGVIPDFDRLAAGDFAGFRLKDTAAQGLSISKVGADEAGRLGATSERSWLLTLHLDPKAYPETFAFPRVLVDGAKVLTKTYRDADLVEVPAVVPLSNLPVQSWQAAARKHFGWVIAGAAGLLALLAVLAIAIFRRKPVAVAGPRYRIPAQPTPFNVIALLRQLQDDAALSLTESRRAELRQAIGELEQAYFAKNASAVAPGDLSGLASKWLKLAGV